MRESARRGERTGAAAGGAATRERLLSVAERLFAEKGLQATSVRDIATAADANLGAVNYHFGSKDALVRAIVLQRIEPLNAARLRMLDEAEARSGGKPSLEDVLRAFISPTIHHCAENPAFMKIAGRLQMDPDPELRAYVLERSLELVERYKVAVTRVLPDVPLEELFWRFSFLAGALFHTWAAAGEIEALTAGLGRVDDTGALIERLVRFGAAGLRAPLGPVAAPPR